MSYYNLQDLMLLYSNGYTFDRKVQAKLNAVTIKLFPV